jgi:hypothetical protein
MKSLSGIMSHESQNQYLASCRACYPSRNRFGKSAMIDEVGDTPGWERKHTIKALNGKVSHGASAQKRGSRPIYTEAEICVIALDLETQRAAVWQAPQADFTTLVRQLRAASWHTCARRSRKDPQVQRSPA